MASTYEKLLKKGLIKSPPHFLSNNIQYETVTGSEAYGCNENDSSDRDIYGFCMEPLDILFPGRAGYIRNFDLHSSPNFEQFQQHHIKDDKKEYDITIFGIAKYFKLCMDGNPNMIDTLFTPTNCILHCTTAGKMVRDNRHLFLSKKCFHTFLGYAYSQRAKIRGEAKKNTESRGHLYEKYGYDVKYAYHLIRLAYECKMLLEEHTIDLTRYAPVYREIRNGLWSLDRVDSFFEEYDTMLQKLNNDSTLRYAPDLEAIKTLLINCLEEHYGSLEKYVRNESKEKIMLDRIRDILNGRL